MAHGYSALIVVSIISLSSNVVIATSQLLHMGLMIEFDDLDGGLSLMIIALMSDFRGIIYGQDKTAASCRMNVVLLKKRERLK